MNARLIDDVARGMTDAAPPADLRARVMAQLADRRAPGRAWMPIVAAASIVVVATAGVLMSRRASSTPGVTAPSVSAPRVAHGETIASIVEVQQRVESPRRVRRAAAAKPPALSGAEAAWQARAIPAIASEPPLAADDIQPESLQLALLEVKPLVNVPVTVAPIGADASEGR